MAFRDGLDMSNFFFLETGVELEALRRRAPQARASRLASLRSVINTDPGWWRFLVLATGVDCPSMCPSLGPGGHQPPSGEKFQLIARSRIRLKRFAFLLPFSKPGSNFNAHKTSIQYPACNNRL
jgi:hypothetical protein